MYTETHMAYAEGACVDVFNKHGMLRIDAILWDAKYLHRRLYWVHTGAHLFRLCISLSKSRPSHSESKVRTRNASSTQRYQGSKKSPLLRDAAMINRQIDEAIKWTGTHPVAMAISFKAQCSRLSVSTAFGCDTLPYNQQSQGTNVEHSNP